MNIPTFTGPCIYIIWNNDNDCFYIGSARNYRQRILKHVRALELGKHHSWKLQRDWNKFSNWETFSLGASTVENLIIDEQWCIDIQKPYYNICQTASSTLGLTWTEDRRSKILPHLQNKSRQRVEKQAESLKNNVEFIAECTKRCVQMSKNNQICIRITDLVTGLHSDFESIKDAVNYVNMSKSTIGKYLREGKLLNNRYKIEKCQQHKY